MRRAQRAAGEGEDDPVAAPAARKIAEENGINIASVAGTGKGGRVTKEDVVAAVAAKKPRLLLRRPRPLHLPLLLRYSLLATAWKNAFR